MEYVKDEEGCRYYVADFGGPSGMATVALPVADVEAVVAQHLTITPVLEGAKLYLQFDSPGDGFAREADEFDYHTSIGEMVDEFLLDHWLTPKGYRESMVELELDLRQALKKIRKAIKDGHLPESVLSRMDAALETEAAEAVASLYDPSKAP